MCLDVFKYSVLVVLVEVCLDVFKYSVLVVLVEVCLDVFKYSVLQCFLTYPDTMVQFTN